MIKQEPAWIGSRLPYGVLEGLAGLESRKLHGRDLDLLLRIAGVDSRPGSALGNAEGAEARDGHGSALLELSLDGHEDGVQDGVSGGLGHLGLRGGGGDECLLGHVV